MTSSNSLGSALIPAGDLSAGVCEGDVCEIVAAEHGASLRDIPLDRPDGTTLTLADYADQVLLVVNVASKCGLAPQYEGLQRLFEENADNGFSVIGFPANDFMGQEPGTNSEIAEFCSINYAVTFPIMAKISVVGPGRHPFYAELTRQAPTASGKDDLRAELRGNGIVPTEDPEILWNFEKFLIGRDGVVLARFAPGVTPDDPVLRDAVASALSVVPRA